jgi:branched-subunit amino acid transport protein
VNNLLLMAVTMALVYTCRWAGFVLTIPRTSPFGERFLRRVPIALFTVLAISSLYKESDLLSLKLIALLVAGGVVWYTRQLGWSVVVGLAILWMLMLAGGNW